MKSSLVTKPSICDWRAPRSTSPFGNSKTTPPTPEPATLWQMNSHRLQVLSPDDVYLRDYLTVRYCAEPGRCGRGLAHGVTRLPCRGQDLRYARLAKPGLRQPKAHAGAADRAC